VSPDNDFESPKPDLLCRTAHSYPVGWGQTSDPSGWGVQWIKDHAASQTTANKPVILEEFGVTSNQAATYTAWYNAIISSGLAGDLIWSVTIFVIVRRPRLTRLGDLGKPGLIFHLDLPPITMGMLYVFIPLDSSALDLVQFGTGVPRNRSLHSPDTACGRPQGSRLDLHHSPRVGPVKSCFFTVNAKQIATKMMISMCVSEV
jgi:hypothetical protein